MNTIQQHRTYRARHPRWPIRAFNGIGLLARKAGLARPLTPERVWRDAQLLSGVSKAADDEVEGLPVLTSSLNRQAELHTFGRFLFRIVLANLGRNHLEVRDYLEKHPEAARQEITRPVFVLGLPRTGTTLVHKLLALNPEARPLMIHETFWPAPQVRGIWRKRDCRRGDVRMVERLMRRFVRGLDEVHPMRADEPEECTWLMANTFTCSVFALLGRVPDYVAWLSGLDRPRWERVYRDYRRQLQVLQDQSSGGYWVLKSPVHMFSLPALLSVFPDARVVQMHRDPLAVVPSCCSLFAVVRSAFSNAIHPQLIGHELVPLLCEMVRRARSCGDERQILHVQYTDLVRDKLGTIRRIHDHFGLAFSPAAEARLLEYEAQDRYRSTHRYDLAQFGLDPDDVLERLGEG